MGLQIVFGEFKFEADPTDPEHRRTRIQQVDPQEEMLYWLIPILPKQSNSFTPEAKDKDWDDYFSAHALSTRQRPVTINDLEKEPYKSRAFDWSNLRGIRDDRKPHN